jgi:hypothetical protein
MFIALFTGPMSTYRVFSSSYATCAMARLSARPRIQAPTRVFVKNHSSLVSAHHSASCSQGCG